MKPDPHLRDRSRSHIADELPLVPNITFADVSAMEAALGLLPTKASIREMRAAVLANVVKARQTAYSAIHYSRGRSHYTRDRYAPRGYSYRTLMAAVEDLVRAGLIVEVRTRPGTHSTWRSRLSLSDAPDWLSEPWVLLTKTVPELLHLKNAKKVRIDYRDTRDTRDVRRDIHAHNEFLSAFKIETPLLPTLCTNGILPRDEEEDEFPVVHRTYYRVFNQNWSLGGRWYGPWWQHVSKEVRASITIDGTPCHEYDFPCFHPQLVCAAARVDLPFNDGAFDFYALDQCHDRSHYKLAVNILLNALSRTSARLALCDKLRAHHGIEQPADIGRDLIARIEGAYPQLAPYWGLGVALRLQNIDGDMISRIQSRLRTRGIPHLSVHDSIVAPAWWMGVVRQIMDEEMQRLRNHLRNFGLSL